MAFDWREYLALARWLQSNTPPGMTQEAAHRCAVTRAYFAAFGHALAHSSEYLEFDPRNAAEDHGRLRAHLRSKRRQRTAECLDRLRAWRNCCDYDAEIPGDLSATLAGAVSEADYVFSSLSPPTPRGP
jgi:hypothetical protein